MNRIIFTCWHKVYIEQDDNKKVMSERKFMQLLARNILLEEYNISYDANDYLFTIIYKGILYNVVLPVEVEESLKTKNYGNLVMNLFKLILYKKRYNDAIETKKRNDEKINQIELSGYSTLDSIEDCGLYLLHLYGEYAKTKSKESRDIINYKILEILNYIANPYNLKYHFNRFIYEIAEKGKCLDQNEKQELEIILRKIADDYYDILSKSNQGFVLGSSTMPLDIVRRIEKTEHLVEEWLSKKKDDEAEPPDIIADAWNNELKEMIDDLCEIMRGSK